MEWLNGLLASKGAIVLGWLALAFVLERLAPAAPRPAALGEGRRFVRNIAFFGLNGLVSLAVVVPVSQAAATVGLGLRPPAWSGWPGLLADLLLLDFLIYWWHRANHRVPLLWRFHEVHHLDRFLDTTTAVRFHFGEVVLSALARAVVIVALAIPLASILVFEALVLVAAIFHHSNLRLPPRVETALAFLIVTPSIHWVHHHRRRQDTDSNYSTILSLWDRLFRSRSPSARTPAMEIGVEGCEEDGFTRLLLRPFRPRESLSSFLTPPHPRSAGSRFATLSPPGRGKGEGESEGGGP